MVLLLLENIRVRHATIITTIIPPYTAAANKKTQNIIELIL